MIDEQSSSKRKSATVPRRTVLARWLCRVLIVAIVVWIFRRLPVAHLMWMLEEWLVPWGNWGPLLFAAIYVVAALLFFPASALTLTAGALFGRLVGTLVVSLASTTAAAFAFLIARYLARRRVTLYVQHHARLQALDRAIEEGGWKIVALLRLSPLIPFNLQNYLYGVTALRFGPYVLTSWLAMLPGTVLYVSIGALGREGLQALGGEHSRTGAEWTLLIVGFLATLTATLYVARLARRALAQRNDIVRRQP